MAWSPAGYRKNRNCKREFQGGRVTPVITSGRWVRRVRSCNIGGLLAALRDRPFAIGRRKA